MFHRIQTEKQFSYLFDLLLAIDGLFELEQRVQLGQERRRLVEVLSGLKRRRGEAAPQGVTAMEEAR